MATLATYGPVAKKPQQPRPRWDFGRKVGLWLADMRAQRREPMTATALSRVVGVDSKTVLNWVERGARPRSDIGQRVAAAMGADYGWLTDNSQGYPPPESAVGLKVALKFMPPDEQRDLTAILNDPVERRSWLASWRARRAGHR